jgi:hypothetical protein
MLNCLMISVALVSNNFLFSLNTVIKLEINLKKYFSFAENLARA